jgi:hypothetical protein
VKLLREKGGVESHGLAVGIAENKPLRTWRERGRNNAEGIHVLAASLTKNGAPLWTGRRLGRNSFFATTVK